MCPAILTACPQPVPSAEWGPSFMHGDSLGLLAGRARLGSPVVLSPQGHPVWREAEGGEVAAPDSSMWEGPKGWARDRSPCPCGPPAGDVATPGTKQ